MSHTAGPASPPQTPVTASPVSHHKPVHGLHGRHSHHLHHPGRNTSSHHATKPTSQHAKFPPPGGLGSNSIPYRPSIFRQDDLSPRSSGSSPTMNTGDDSDDAENDADDDDDEDVDDDEEMDSDSDASSSASPTPSRSSSPQWRAAADVPRSAAPNAPAVPDAFDALDLPSAPDPAADSLSGFVLYAEETLIIEEISDFDSEDGRLLVLRPTTIEEAESSEGPSSPTPVPSHTHHRDRSRHRTPPVFSSSPSRPDIDGYVMHGLEDLTCRGESDEDGAAVDDERDLTEAEYNFFRLRDREEKRHRRMTSGSISKRTISESIGSDTDTEDLSQMPLDANDVGASARRLRRRLDRHSLLFADPPPPRIEELDEPDTTDDDMIRDGETLARELPYYTLEYISMEVDSA